MLILLCSFAAAFDLVNFPKFPSLPTANAALTQGGTVTADSMYGGVDPSTADWSAAGLGVNTVGISGLVKGHFNPIEYDDLDHRLASTSVNSGPVWFNILMSQYPCKV